MPAFDTPTNVRKAITIPIKYVLRIVSLLKLPSIPLSITKEGQIIACAIIVIFSESSNPTGCLND